MRFILSFLLMLVAAPALACGPDSRCEVAEGYYLASPPADWDGESPLPVVVYFHGWNSSPEGTFRNKAMVRGVNNRGALFVAPWARTGYWRQIGDGRAEGGRDEAAFIRAVMADVAARWPVDQSKVLASGFSRGASMVWNAACYVGDLFTGFAPIAGGFWGSTPRDCPSGPVNMRHIHGTTDRVVAFDEVGVYNSMPITHGWSLYEKLNGCGPVTSTTSRGRGLECRLQSGCASGKSLELCLHPRGHSIPAEWVAEGFDWMVGLDGE